LCIIAKQRRGVIAEIGSDDLALGILANEFHAGEILVHMKIAAPALGDISYGLRHAIVLDRANSKCPLQDPELLRQQIFRADCHPFGLIPEIEPAVEDERREKSQQ
jgi:hypothetical protein